MRALTASSRAGQLPVRRSRRIGGGCRIQARIPGSRPSSPVAAQGTKVVVSARGEQAVASSVVAEILGSAGDTTSVVIGVGPFRAGAAVASLTAQKYGRVGTSVSCAAVSLFASFQDTTPEEFRWLSEVNSLGQVSAALAALPPPTSIVSLPNTPPTAPLITPSKAPWTPIVDLMAADIPLSVTSVKPATINTRRSATPTTKMDVKPRYRRPLTSQTLSPTAWSTPVEHPVRDSSPEDPPRPWRSP
jgi:NADP-dependent 3-hydroxy acid dehydrogenase YdfG